MQTEKLASGYFAEVLTLCDKMRQTHTFHANAWTVHSKQMRRLIVWQKTAALTQSCKRWPIVSRCGRHIWGKASEGLLALCCGATTMTHWQDSVTGTNFQQSCRQQVPPFSSETITLLRNCAPAADWKALCGQEQTAHSAPGSICTELVSWRQRPTDTLNAVWAYRYLSWIDIWSNSAMVAVLWGVCAVSCKRSDYFTKTSQHMANYRIRVRTHTLFSITCRPDRH